MICPKCNAQNTDDSKFCTRCGAQLSLNQQQAPSAFRCTNCNQPLRLGMEQVGVDSRGLPVMHNHGYCDQCRLKFDLDNQPPVNLTPPPVRQGMRCGRCGSDNIIITLETFSANSKGRNETRKKSVVTRAGNSLGRTAMIGMTGGLWALTPKKSKYTTVGKAKTNYVQNKIAICQNCGNSWIAY